jgi:hypothetical protein
MVSRIGVWRELGFPADPSAVQTVQVRPQRNRIHIEIWVPHDQAETRITAAIVAGGHLVLTSTRRRGGCLRTPRPTRLRGHDDGPRLSADRRLDRMYSAGVPAWDRGRRPCAV